MEAKKESVVPRGFSKYYVLYLLKEKPMTGKEIMNEAEKRSEGIWKPSPGLVYPLLGRLHRQGFIEEGEGGKFKITPSGGEALTQYIKMEQEIKKRVEAVKTLGYQIFTAGKLIVEDMLTELISGISKLQVEVTKLSKEKREEFLIKYKAFLESELNRVQEELKK
jgi:DNA-binding PadR family transcriptional regulator